MMNKGRIALILFSYLVLFPLEKKTFVYAQNDKIYYRVRSGDSLEKIAGKYSVSPKDIQKWNGIKNPDRLLKNQRLVIYRDYKESVGVARHLKIGDSFSLRVPADRWQVIRHFRAYGDSSTPGILCRLIGSETVKAANSGTIVRISELRGYGKYILIDHGKGWHSLYSNLENIQVKLGQRVNPSDIIGDVKDNKLFFLLAYNGKPVDPTGYFKR